MASLLVSVLGRKMVPTDGPLLRTLVKLCIKPIGPRPNAVVWVSFNWRFHDNDNDSVKNVDRDSGKSGRVRW